MNSSSTLHKPASEAPTTAAAQTSPVSVLITHHQVALLDEIAASIRRNTGAVISRSALLRAIASAVLPHSTDWLNCTSAEELRKQIALRLEVAKRIRENNRGSV